MPNDFGFLTKVWSVCLLSVSVFTNPALLCFFTNLLMSFLLNFLRTCVGTHCRVLARVKGIVGEGELALSAAGLLTTTLGSATQSLPHRETANTKIQKIQKYTM